MTLLNADFSRRAVVHADSEPWIPSPMPGVDRRPLDRIGDEVARATTVVRYAPGSAFSPHVHGGGEEFLVLEGVFQDEHGDYPAGSYVRNPPTSSHTPASAPGCTILVKLWQFDPDDRTWVRIAPGEVAFEPRAPGAVSALLHRDAFEEVRLERWDPGARIALSPRDGVEIFVLGGGFREAGETFGRWSWLRLPKGARLDAEAGPDGAAVWMKTGHLARAPKGPGRDD